MKTPRRKHCDIYKCEKCGGYGITFTADDTTSALYQCSLCGTCWHMPGLPKRTRTFRARCIRKNREARLKHALRKYRFRAEQLEHCGKRWNKIVSKYMMEVKRVYSASSTYGQDIEGS